MGKLFNRVRMIIMEKIIIRITAKKSSSVIVSKQGSIISRLDYEGKYNSLPRQHKKNKSIIQILVESDESENERRTRKDKNSTSQ